MLIDKHAKIAQGLFGYCTYDAVQFFETIELKSKKETAGNSCDALQALSICNCY